MNPEEELLSIECEGLAGSTPTQNWVHYPHGDGLTSSAQPKIKFSDCKHDDSTDSEYTCQLEQVVKVGANETIIDIEQIDNEYAIIV